MAYKQYSMEQKLAYYKKKAAANRRKYNASSLRTKVSGKGAYRVTRPVRTNRVPRRTNRYRGVATGIGSAIGGFAGNLLGGPAGGALGTALGGAAAGLIGKIAGMGDYKVNVNTLVYPDSVPEFQNLGPRATIVRHREFICDIVSPNNGPPTLFNNQTFRIQPGNSQTFPWLSQVAQNYEQYRFHGLVFESKTMSGSMSSTPQLGTVVLATQYNSLSPAFANKQEMENYEFASSVVPSQSVIHPVECDPKQTQCNGIFNVQTEDFATGDLRLYDLGRFNIATIGLPVSNETVSELWVSYEVCLYKPRLVPDSGSNSDHWHFATGITTSAYFGTDAVLVAGSDNFTSLTTTTIKFDRSFSGNVMVSYNILGTTGANGRDPALIGSNGVSALNLLGGNLYNQYQTDYDATLAPTTHAQAFFSVLPLQDGSIPTITFSAGTLPLSPTSGDLIVLQFSSDLVS